ncbi:hypothetical protein I4U23_021959 [Adineta vaga]|nr:hypothetical protein I4U23_021959 [Adineta vaga]
MNRLISSVNKSRDVNTPRLKRTLSNRVVEEEKENMVDNNSQLAAKKKKVDKNASQHTKDKSFDDVNILINEPIVTPLRSTISISSVSKRSSLSNNTNERSLVDIEPLCHSQQPIRLSTVDSSANSTVSQASSSRNVLSTANTNNRLNSSSVGRNSQTTRLLTRTSTQPTTTSSSSRITNSIVDTQRQTPRHMSQHSSSINMNRFGTPKRKNSINSLVESSVEFREMKRLYLNEKKLCHEWRKDFQILKRQLADLRASTIPRPSADIIDWLNELFQIVNNNGLFKGDGRSLKKIAADLGLDETAMVVVAARTPQLYVRTLHNNLSFTMTDMRRAIATSIRSARCEIRRYERHHDQQLNSSTNDDDANDDSIGLQNDTHEDNEEEDNEEEDNDDEDNEEREVSEEGEENIGDGDEDEEENEHTNSLFIDDEADDD